MTCCVVFSAEQSMLFPETLVLCLRRTVEVDLCTRTHMIYIYIYSEVYVIPGRCILLSSPVYTSKTHMGFPRCQRRYERGKICAA